jgi:hypothetical protein
MPRSHLGGLPRDRVLLRLRGVPAGRQGLGVGQLPAQGGAPPTELFEPTPDGVGPQALIEEEVEHALLLLRDLGELPSQMVGLGPDVGCARAQRVGRAGKLIHQRRWVAQDADDGGPYGLLDPLGRDRPTAASRAKDESPSARTTIRPAPVGDLHRPCVLTEATAEQAPQEIWHGVRPTHKDRAIARELLLRALEHHRLDDGRHGDRDPLLTGSPPVKRLAAGLGVDDDLAAIEECLAEVEAARQYPRHR